MYRILLLLLGLLFLSLALLGTGYLYVVGRPQELHGLIDNVAVPTGAPTEAPVSTEPGITEGAIEPTDTPAPTAIPSDTPTPLPSATAVVAATQPLELTYCVQSNSAGAVSVSSGPGRQYQPLGDPLPVGTCLNFSAQNEENTWLLIAPNQPDQNLQQYEGGWISRQLLGLAPSDPVDLPPVTLTPTPVLGLNHVPIFTQTTRETINRPLEPALSFKPVSYSTVVDPRSDSGNQPAGDSTTENFQIEANWPRRMEVGGSGTIRVALVKTEAGLVPTVQTSGDAPLVFTPIAVGTPGQDLGAAFGEGYRAKSAVAKIAGASFDIQPVLPAESQSLDQPQIVWTWNISSDTVAKNQAVDLTIQIEWERVGDPADVKNPVIWREHMGVDVFQPFLKAGQVSAMNLFSAFLGSGLSIPWLYEKLSKRKAEPQKKTKKRA